MAEIREDISSQEAKKCSDIIIKIKGEVKKVLVGQEKIVDGLIKGLLCDGHILVEGVPGVAKTLAVRALSEAIGCESKRVQFTVDLLPTDILGLTSFTSGKGFEIIKGPIFTNFLLADEINRSPPKCVLGDTPVLLESGEVSDIRDIVKSYNGRKVYREGSEYWIVPHTPLKLLAFNPADGKIKPEEVKYLYKQKTSAPYYEVSLKSGRKIKTSSIHPFFTFKEGKVSTLDAQMLKEGDCVLIPRRISIPGSTELLIDNTALKKSHDIYKEIARRKDLYVKIQACKKMNMGYAEIKEKLLIDYPDEQIVQTFLEIKPRYLEYSEEYFFCEAKQFGQVRGIKQPLSVTKELAQFMAILIAEGHVNRSYFYMTMKDKDLLILFITLLKSLFDLNVHLLFDKKRKMHRLAFRSDALVHLLRAIGYDPHKRAGKKFIPPFILRATNDIIKEFLRVYYDCDGCVSRDCVKVTTKSKRIANALSYLLLRMGFVVKIGRELSKTHIGGYVYRRRFYNLRLYGGELYDFSLKINFFTEKNRKKLVDLIHSTQREKIDLIPGMHQTIRNLRKEHHISHMEFYRLTGMHAHNIENPKNALMHSRFRLGKIARAFRIEHFTKLIESDFYCDFVKENKIIQPKKEYWLYDFSMKNTHSFVAGFGGMISHNTQSALLEAMQEKIVTIGKETYPLPKPFFVMATENPLEVSGVYFLPEAQIDRFLFKILMGYPKKDEEQRIMRQNMTLKPFEEYDLKAVSNPKQLIEMQEITKRVYTSQEIERYIVEIVQMTRQKEGYEESKYVEWGGSPRATIGLFIASKAQALISGRKFVTPDDVKKVAHDILRHRMILNYAAQADGISSDHIINKILEKVAAP